MLVFIDDSGDPSFSFSKGASKLFVICCVIFADELEAEKTAVAIKELRRKLNFPTGWNLNLMDRAIKRELHF